MISSAAIVSALKRRTPPSLYPFARTVYHRVVAPIECWSVAAADHLLRRTYEGRVLPPALMRFKVRGSPSGDAFARIGRSSADDINAALVRFGIDLGSHRAILDFGCGCGGTLVWLHDLAPTASISGTDIDANAIGWCRANLPFARFATNEALPPLSYPDAAFDLAIAVSVFTHLDEDYQFRWLAELRRVIKPGGTCVITLHGPQSWNQMSEPTGSVRPNGLCLCPHHCYKAPVSRLVSQCVSSAILCRGTLFGVLRRRRKHPPRARRPSGHRGVAATCVTTVSCARRCCLQTERDARVVMGADLLCDGPSAPGMALTSSRDGTYRVSVA